jgi:hypothetical protein
MRTLDWGKLERFVAERKPVDVSAGILNDWFWTAAPVYENGVWKSREDAYVTSSWALPGFKATMENGDVIEVAAAREQTEAEAKAESAMREGRLQRARETLANLQANA